MIHKHLTLFILISFLLSSINHVLAQPGGETFGNRFCRCLEMNKAKPDSSRIKECRLSMHADLAAMTKSKRDSVLEEMDVYLLNSCKEFMRVMTSNRKSNKGDWETLNSNPASTLSEDGCRSMPVHSAMYYLQGNGDTTFVRIADGYWTETLDHGKYFTTEKFTWLNKCDFELEFLQSNSPIDNKYDKKGDKKTYRIIEKTGGYYVITVSNRDIVLKFKLYY